MRFLKVIFILILIYNGLTANANDSLRIVSFPKHLHVFAKFNSSFSQIEIQNPDITNNLQLQPNAGRNLKLGFYYSWLGLAYSFILPSDKLSKDKFGKTKGYTLDAHLMKTRFMLDVFYKHYSGYYLSNPGKFIDNWDTKNPFPQMSDLTTSVLSASFSYVFRPERFSPKAAYAYTRTMRKRGGSWMIGGFASLSTINSDSSIVSNEIKQFVDPKLELKKVTFSDVGVSFGYSYLLTVMKKNFISFTLLPGISYQSISQNSAIDGSNKKIDAVSLRSVVRFSLGRNGDRHYWGFATYIESSLIKNLNTELSLGSGYAEFFYGYRINTANWNFMKGVDKVLHPQFLRFVTGKSPDRE